MCDNDCNYAYCSFPEEEPRLLKLADPLHYVADACGRVSIDGSRHLVSNGALNQTDSDGQSFGIAIQLVLPASTGCNLIRFLTPPILTIVIDGNVTIVDDSPKGSRISDNVLTYEVSTQDLKAGAHCITSITFEGVWGQISLGCGCDQSDECRKVFTSLWLIGSRVDDY